MECSLVLVVRRIVLCRSQINVKGSIFLAHYFFFLLLLLQPFVPRLASCEDYLIEHTMEGYDPKIDDKHNISSEESQNEDEDTAEVTLQVRREKRLAMNRASARARRKRKKVMLETLGHQNAELTKQNLDLVNENIALKAQLDKLEAALEQSKVTIAALATRHPGVYTSQPSLYSLGVSGEIISPASNSMQSLLPSITASNIERINRSSLLGDQMLNLRAVQLLQKQLHMNTILDTSGLESIPNVGIKGASQDTLGSLRLSSMPKDQQESRIVKRKSKS